MAEKLTFTTTSLLTTTVANATDALYFDVQTPAWAPHLTTVRRLDARTGTFELTASIRSEQGRPVAVSLYGGAFEPVAQWLKRVDGAVPGDSRWQFDDGEGNVFAWRAENRELRLHSADDSVKMKRPLATFHQHKRYLMVGMVSQHAYLDIDNAVVESVDAILVSLLIVERKRRAGLLA